MISNEIKSLGGDASLQLGLLYRRVNSGKERLSVLWLPKSKVVDILYEHHDSPLAGHLGLTRLSAESKSDIGG